MSIILLIFMRDMFPLQHRALETIKQSLYKQKQYKSKLVLSRAGFQTLSAKYTGPYFRRYKEKSVVSRFKSLYRRENK